MPGTRSRFTTAGTAGLSVLSTRSISTASSAPARRRIPRWGLFPTRSAHPSCCGRCSNTNAWSEVAGDGARPSDGDAQSAQADGYLPFEPNAAHLFFQLVSRRYERGSMLITSNRSIGEWGTVFGDAVVATAILDRLLHHSHVITIRGDSYRLREKRRSGLMPQRSAEKELEKLT